MTATDNIESEVRVMLHRRAGDIDPSTLDVPDFARLDALRLAPVPPNFGRRRARGRLIATVALSAVTAIVVLTIAIRASDDTTAPVVAGVPTTTPSPTASLPPGFEPQTAASFFTSAGTPDDVAKAYLRDRLHAPALEVRAAASSVVGDVVTIRLTSPFAGSILLRRDDTSWAVVASTTDGIDLSDVVREGRHVRGVARNAARQSSFAADVLDLSGNPVPAAPFPQGVPGAEYLYATAARGSAPDMPIDVVVPDQSVVLRVYTVGGALLSVSEIRFDPAPIPQDCTTTTPPFVFSSLPSGWAVSLNSAWLAGQPSSARQGARGPGRVDSGFDTAVYIEIGLGASPVTVLTTPFPPPPQSPVLEGVTGSVLRSADGYVIVFDKAVGTCPLYLAFHGVDLTAAVAIANGLQRA